MATKAQAQALLTAAYNKLTAYINGLPASSNITDGGVQFGPTRATVQLTAIDATDAANLETAIAATLTAQSIVYVITRERRKTGATKAIEFNIGSDAIRIVYT